MWDEDPDYIAPEGIESVQHTESSIQKVIQDGQLFILRDGKRYNVTGGLVK